MSYKATTFAVSCPGPKTLDKFVVWIPGVINSPLRVSATTYPLKSRSLMTVYAAGQPVYVPSKVQYPGSWSCTIDESVLNDAYYFINKLQEQVPDVVTSVKRNNLIEPIIFITDQFTGSVPQYWGTLKGAWVESVEPLQLSWDSPDKPIKWRLTFRYTSISNNSLISKIV